MSRQQWTESISSNRFPRRHHEPLEGRTTDPRALEYDEAWELFVQGLRLARGGDISAGCSQIATAFLLDGRAINFCVVLPPGDPTAAGLVLDYELLRTLITENHGTYAADVLQLIIARYLGHTSPDGQTFIAGAMDAIEFLLQRIKQNPNLEAHWNQGGVLGGCMTRKALLYQRSTFHMAMGNHSKAIRDLTKALDIDPGYTRARDARAGLWASMKLKEPREIFAEYEQIIAEVHQDDKDLEVPYAWLACYALDDGNLGSLEDAHGYYEKSLRACARRDELYGRRDPKEHPPILQRVKEKFGAFASAPPSVRKFRQDIDVALLSGQVENLRIPATMRAVPASSANAADTSLLHSCLKCGKTGTDIGKKLSKCGRCGRVSYCSRACQVDDWKQHKIFCKQACSEQQKRAPASRDAENTMPPEPTPAKTPISELNGQARSVVRMETELKQLYTEYGRGFADWWHNMTVKEREERLLQITHQTLPRRMPKPYEIQLGLKRGDMWLAASLDCNVEIMVGQCGCHKESGSECPHYFPDRLLHELYIRAVKPEAGYNNDRKTCVQLRKEGVFPDQNPGRLAVIKPASGEGPEQHDLNVLYFKDSCPEKDKEEYKQMIADGKILDASVGIYVLVRRLYVMRLLVKLFDEYQLRVRRAISTNPLERLDGCTFCKQTCEADTALRCSVCEASWWCSSGCKDACGHGKHCPVGVASESRVMFNLA